MAIHWASLSVRGSKTALRAGFMTGLPRSARNDERGESVQLRLSKCHSTPAPVPAQNLLLIPRFHYGVIKVTPGK